MTTKPRPDPTVMMLSMGLATFSNLSERHADPAAGVGALGDVKLTPGEIDILPRQASQFREAERMHRERRRHRLG